MSTKLKLKQEMKNAMKSKEKDKLSTIRFMLSVIQKEEIDKNKGKELSDSKVLELISTEVKQTKDALSYVKDDTKTEQELSDRISVLQSFLPEQLTEEEVREIIQDAITSNGFSGKQDMGKVMKVVMPKVKNKTDGSLVNRIVKELL